MLLDIVDRSCEYAVQMLRSKAEVKLADRLEGYPNVVAIVEAANRQGLAEAVIPVLESIDGVTEDLRLLVTQDNEISLEFVSSSYFSQQKDGVRRRQHQGKGDQLAREMTHA
jgi:hypothetical protein